METYTAIETPVLPRPFGSEIDRSSYEAFLARLSGLTHIQQTVFTFPYHCPDPLPCLKTLDLQNEFQFYWEKPNDKYAIAAGGSLTEISASGPDRFLKAAKSIEVVKKKTLHYNGTSSDETGIHFLGGFSFFDDGKHQWENFKPACFTLARRTIISHNHHSTLSIAIRLKKNRSPQYIHKQLENELKCFAEPSGFHSFTTNGLHANEIVKNSIPAYPRWKSAIKKAKKQIENNTFKKIVLSRSLTISSKRRNEPTTILHNLRNQYPKCCAFLIRHGSSEAFIGCSPERLFSLNERQLQTEALAGSIARGETPQADQTLKTRLLNSKKDNEEQQLVVRDIEEQLQSVVNNVCISDKTCIKKMTNVQHLCSAISANIRPDVTALHILERLHPTAAVGGYPRNETLTYLSENKWFDRGWFGAPVGWINTNNSCEFTVAIRCGLISDYTARLFAGCGIVADSEAEAEWQESELKFIPMLSALNDD